MRYAAIMALKKLPGTSSRPHLQQADVGVRDGRDFAVHDAAGCAHDAAAKHLADALVAHAHAEQRQARPQLAHDLHGHA